MSGRVRHSIELEKAKPPLRVLQREGMKSAWRPDLYVVARFLERLYTSERVYTIRQLQMAVRLNYDLYKKYLDFLLTRELVIIVHGPDDARTVRMGPKGRDAYHRFVGWVKTLEGNDTP